MQTQKKAPVKTEAINQNMQSNYKPVEHFSLFITHNQTNTNKFLSWPELVKLSNKPTIGPKDKAKLITSFKSNGKTKEHAEKAEHWALVIDHDHDNLTETQLKAKYEPYQVAHNAFTTSSHLQIDANHPQAQNRWKVVIPLACSGSADQIEPIANGLALMFGADKAQARKQQGFYAPNKLTHDAPYSSFCEELYPMLDINDIGHPLIFDAFNALEKHEQEQTKQAEQAPAKPRDIPEQGGIIDKVNAAGSIAPLIEQYGYQRKRKAWLSPQSESGQAGVYIFIGKDGKERLYSHHGESDPLSNLNHNGHSLDAFDVLACLRFNGDTQEAVKVLANELDEAGQKQRQREHMTNKNAITEEAFEKLPKTKTFKAFTLPDYPEELLDLPYQLGEIQAFIFNRMTYPSTATAGITAIATLAAFAQTNITVKSRDGLGLNEQFMILAATGFGKEDLRKPLDILHRESDQNIRNEKTALGYESVKLYHSAPSSQQGLHRLLEENRSAYFISDEFAEWLRMSHSNDHKQATLGYFMQIYTKALGIVEPGHTITNKYEQVKNPRVGILATSTAEAIFETMTKEQADSGAYNRWVIFVGDQELPDKRYDGLIYEPNETIVDFIAWLKLQDEAITFTKDGFNEYKKLDSELSEPIKRIDACLGGRLGEQAIKLAALVALSDRRFRIESHDLRIAFNIRIGLYKRAAALSKHEGSLSGMHKTGEAMEQVKDLLIKNRILYKSQIRIRSRKFAKLSTYEQKTVMEMLIDYGMAAPVEGQPKIIASLIYDEVEETLA